MITREEFSNIFKTMVVYASSPEKPEYVVAPSPQSQQAGTKPLDTLPAQWWNWFLQEATKRFNGDANLIGNMVSEIENLLALCNITPDPDSVTQLRDMFDNQYRDLIMGDVEPRLEEVENNIQQNIVPQIDAVKSEIQNEIDPKIQAINEKIPEQASATNQLADKEFVNSIVATNTANFRGTFPNWESVPTEVNGYNSDYTGNKTPTENDYMVVRDASGYGIGEATVGEKQAVSLEEDGLTLAPYTTYGSIDMPAGTSSVRFYGPSGKTFRYYVNTMSDPNDLKSFTLQGPDTPVSVDVRESGLMVVMIKPAEWSVGSDVLYASLVLAPIVLDKAGIQSDAEEMPLILSFFIDNQSPIKQVKTSTMNAVVEANHSEADQQFATYFDNVKKEMDVLYSLAKSISKNIDTLISLFNDSGTNQLIQVYVLRINNDAVDFDSGINDQLRYVTNLHMKIETGSSAPNLLAFAEEMENQLAQCVTPAANLKALSENMVKNLDAKPYKGTWRFKYSGDWATNGRDGWSPEYQISPASLTAAQLAALNSGATAERLSKLAPDGTYTGGGITYNGTKYNNMKVVSSNGLVTFNFE